METEDTPNHNRDIDEYRTRNLIQLEDAKRFYPLACLMLEKDALTDDELMMWYTVIGLAQMFAVAWKGGKEPLNLYFTGLAVEREPTLVDGWRHFVDYLDSLVSRVPTKESCSQ